MFSFFQGKPAAPRVIYLRGEPRRNGLEVGENPENLSELLESLAPAPFVLRAPAGVSSLLLEWLWLERGYRMPAVLVEPGFSLRVLDQAESFPEQQHPFFTPAEIIQLELARAVASSIPRFVHRDYVLAQARAAGVELDPRLLGRLSKYLRKLLQAGWTLPAPAAWAELAHTAPFDEIARGLESLRLRTPLEGARRSQLIFQALTEDTCTLETFQAIEEFWAASGQVFPEFRLEPRALLRDLLRHPLHQLERWARQTPDFEERILGVERLSAPSLPRLARLALLAQELNSEQRLELESYLGPLPQLLATPAQQRLARQRLGP
ncbi:MAG: hypothetical protein KF760_20780 [Candidatus Eremiobacteraeota bacterium]|nr:hypothetical protein [Candidatus Eremiobacteraeota bacterium]MCW5871555.1 hypothetical protein [Candidatus Eremiobacteraeota bacterium]